MHNYINESNEKNMQAEGRKVKPKESDTTQTYINNNSTSKIGFNEEQTQKLNSNFQSIFKEFGRLDKVTSAIGALKCKNQDQKQTRVKALEIKLQEFCSEISRMDFDIMNNKLEALEVDNLFLKQASTDLSHTKSKNANYCNTSEEFILADNKYNPSMTEKIKDKDRVSI
jgi:TRAP-type mannitol/chloroaromatic compound transport system substrate-binding protein